MCAIWSCHSNLRLLVGSGGTFINIYELKSRASASYSQIITFDNTNHPSQARPLVSLESQNDNCTKKRVCSDASRGGELHLERIFNFCCICAQSRETSGSIRTDK